MSGGGGVAGSGAVGDADVRGVKVCRGCPVGAEIGAGVGGVWVGFGIGVRS